MLIFTIKYIRKKKIFDYLVFIHYPTHKDQQASETEDQRDFASQMIYIELF